MKKKNNSLIMAHYYVNDELFELANIRGDSYALAVAAARSDSDNIVVAGVRFMAETARILCRDRQKVFALDTQAGCPMADMITKDAFVSAYDAIESVSGKKPVPVLYVNSTAQTKAAVGERDGITCTSSNAAIIMRHVLDQGRPVFFMPDENLALNTARQIGIEESQIAYVDQDGVSSGSTDAKIYVWRGFCHVHRKFSMKDVELARSRWTSARIIVHPESDPEIVDVSDFSGSTSQLLSYFQKLPAHSTVVVGTELSFVKRLAAYRDDVRVYALATSPCYNMAMNSVDQLRTTLSKIDKHGMFMDNEVILSPEIIKSAGLALGRMIEVVENEKQKTV